MFTSTRPVSCRDRDERKRVERAKKNNRSHLSKLTLPIVDWLTDEGYIALFTETHVAVAREGI